MARPARFNADYYTHAADLRNDRRVKAIRTKFGAAGYGLLHMLLETLADADHTHLDTAPLELELLAGDFGVSATEIHSLLQFGESIGYFARNETGLLGCPDLSKWLEPVFEKRNRSKNPSTGELLPKYAAKTGVSATETTQSKVKESKEKPSDDGSAGEASSPSHLTAEVVSPEKLAVPAAADPARAAALATTDPADEQHWSVGPLTKPAAFRIICERLGHLNIDFEYYRRVALVAAEDANISRTIQQWTSWIRKFFENQLRGGGGPLLKPTDGDAARTGVHAPQHPDAYRHEVRPELQAQRDAERQSNTAARIAANLARSAAAQGQLTQPGAVAVAP